MIYEVGDEHQTGEAAVRAAPHLVLRGQRLDADQVLVWQLQHERVLLNHPLLRRADVTRRSVLRRAAVAEHEGDHVDLELHPLLRPHADGAQSALSQAGLRLGHVAARDRAQLLGDREALPVDPWLAPLVHIL